MEVEPLNVSLWQYYAKKTWHVDISTFKLKTRNFVGNI